MGQKEFETLLQFFKALANENRLKLLGILANQECSVQELAALLELKEPTVSHHLAKLKEMGLVEMEVDGNTHLYRLDIDGLQTMNREVMTSFTSDRMASLVDDLVDYSKWEKKVLRIFLEGDQIKQVPARMKKRLVVLKWLVSYFEEGKRYNETEVNGIIEAHHPEYTFWRRELIDYGLMERKEGVYWRVAGWEIPELG